jgi:hypothetical protein
MGEQQKLEDDQLEYAASGHEQVEFTYESEPPAYEAETPDISEKDFEEAPARGKGFIAAVAAVVCALALFAGGFLSGRLQRGHEEAATNTEGAQEDGEKVQAPAGQTYAELEDWLCEQLSAKGSVTRFQGNDEYHLDEIIVGDFDGDGLFPEALRLHLGPDAQGQMTDSINVTFWSIGVDKMVEEQTISQPFVELAEDLDAATSVQTQLEEGDVCRTFIDTFIINQRSVLNGLDLILTGEQYLNGTGGVYSFLVHYESGTAVIAYGARGVPQPEYRMDDSGNQTLHYDHQGIYQFYGPYPNQTELSAVYTCDCSVSSLVDEQDYERYIQIESPEYYLKRPVLAYDEVEYYGTKVFYGEQISLTGDRAKIVAVYRDYNGNSCYVVETDTGMRGFVDITTKNSGAGFARVTLQDLPFGEVFSTEPLTEEEKNDDLYGK